MPSLKNPSKIFSKEHTLESPFAVHHIDPQTLISISHNLKGLPKWSKLLNLNIFGFASLQQRVDINGAIVGNGRLISDSEDV